MKKGFVHAGCTVATILVAALIVILLTGVTGSEARGSEDTGVPRTTDIGWSFPDGRAEIKASSFSPRISREEAISTVRKILHESFGIADPQSLPTDATVALFTGEAHDGRGYVENLPVWIVVVREIPFVITGGPRGTADIPTNRKVGLPQYNVAVDAYTGTIVQAVLSGRVK